MGGMRTAVSRWVGAPLLLLVVLVGCSEPPNLFPDYVDVPGPTTPASATAPECPRDGVGLGARVDGELSESSAGRIPDGFVPVQVLHCTVAESPVAPGRVRAVERKSGITDQLLVALDLPDQEFAFGSNLACPARAYPPTLLLLLDPQGRAITVRQPLDPCGEPRDEVVEAIAALDVTEVSSYIFDDGAS